MVGRDALRAVHGELRGRRFALLVDRRVLRLHGPRVRDVLGSPRVVIDLPSGEAAKRVEVASRVWMRLASVGLRRGDAIVVVGGGAALDLGGFVASTWMRGVPWLAIPTTLLAQVDACVGGKTALDLDAGKNLVGTFHPPVAALADPEFLLTVKERDYRAALFEILKLGWLGSPELVAAALSADLARRAPVAVGACVQAALRRKASLVQQDPFDRGRRRLLNLGHTFGHAIEAATGYAIVHGEAVGVGLLAAAHAAHAAGLLGARGFESRRTQVLALEPPCLDQATVARAVRCARLDKKSTRGADLVVVLPTARGARIVQVTPQAFRAALASASIDRSKGPHVRPSRRSGS